VAADPVVKEIHIGAPPGTVFQFLTDPVKMLQWMGVRADLQPRPGGIYFLSPNGREIIRGSYLEVVPNSKIVFTWGFDQPGHSVPAGSTVVEIELKPKGDGTLLRLTHRELPPSFRDRHDSGWSHYVARLKSVCEGKPLGPDAYADPKSQHG
jgi:uncharacterized protein YndB with AHSA1/START domain